MNLDEHIGRTIRTRRRLLGMTQSDLAAKLGVGFQQIQKYESGVNRTTAARLYEIATALEMRVGEVFESWEHRVGA